MARRLADVIVVQPVEEALQPGPPQGSGRSRSRLRRPHRPRRRRRRQTAPRPRVRLSPWRVLAGLASLLSFALLAVLWYAPMFRVQTVFIQGLVRVPESALTNWPPLQALPGTPVVAVDTQDLARRMQEAFPAFRQVRVWAGFPNRVYVQVEEREPVLVWKDRGQTYWVDAQGVRFYAYGPADPDWPVVEAGTNHVKLTADAVAHLLDLARRIPYRPLMYHSRYGFGWRDPGGWPVYLGDSLDDLGPRLTLYRNLQAELKRRGVKPVYVLLLSPRAVVVRMEEEGEP